MANNSVVEIFTWNICLIIRIISIQNYFTEIMKSKIQLHLERSHKKFIIHKWCRFCRKFEFYLKEDIKNKQYFNKAVNDFS